MTADALVLVSAIYGIPLIIAWFAVVAIIHKAIPTKKRHSCSDR